MTSAAFAIITGLPPDAAPVMGCRAAVRPGVEDGLGPVAVVGVDVDDGHPAGAGLPQPTGSCNKQSGFHTTGMRSSSAWTDIK